MIHVGAFEAKTHLPKLLERVAQGEHIIISKHGVPVAELVPVRRVSLNDRYQAIEKLKAFRVGKRAGEPIRHMIEEGRC